MPLLSQDTTRSDAPESPPAASPIQPTTASIELEELAPSANLAFHSATGKFAERAHETAFAARLFRLAYPWYVAPAPRDCPVPCAHTAWQLSGEMCRSAWHWRTGELADGDISITCPTMPNSARR